MATKNVLSHLDAAGSAQMVDVSAKPSTERRAIAEGELSYSAALREDLATGQTAKGDLYTVAKIAGIQAAKHTGELIPLCHPLPLTYVDVRFRNVEGELKVLVQAEARTTGPTGVEMEALTAASVALLTLYDMLKAADKTLTLGNIRLVSKEGGKSGTFSNKGNPSRF